MGMGFAPIFLIQESQGHEERVEKDIISFFALPPSPPSPSPALCYCVKGILCMEFLSLNAIARALGTHSYAETNLNARSKAKVVFAFLHS
jgi:hypothetical protein